jgi:dipeptidyl aminopeptidase/acylaminoacyl peptidase
VATYLDKNDPPIVVFHGTEDNVVPFCQGEQFFVALQDAGVKSEFYPVEGGGHGFNMYTEENLAHMVEFFDAVRNK